MAYELNLKTATAALALAAALIAGPARADSGFKALAGVPAVPMSAAEMKATQGTAIFYSELQFILYGSPVYTDAYTDRPLYQHESGYWTIEGTDRWYLPSQGYFWEWNTDTWHDLNGNVWNNQGQQIMDTNTSLAILDNAYSANDRANDVALSR